MILQYFHPYKLANTLGMALALLSITPTWADSLSDQFVIRDFGPGDQIFLQRQYELAEQLVYDGLLTRLNGEKQHDLRLLQRMLDQKKIQPYQKRELQALGSVLGKLLAEEYRLKWVVYVDQLGRSRGLRIDQTRQVIFPLTMISRRVEADAEAGVSRIYNKASEVIRYTRANSPLYSD
ncbi:MAG: DUF3806 domain-containing protein [Pseudomonadales bacterium]